MIIPNTKYGLTDPELIDAVEYFHSMGVADNAVYAQDHVNAANELKTEIINDIFKLAKLADEKNVSPEMVKRSLQEVSGFPYRMHDAATNKMVVMNADGHKMPKTFGTIISRISTAYTRNNNSLDGFETYKDVRDFLKPVVDNFAKVVKAWDKLEPEQKLAALALFNDDDDVSAEMELIANLEKDAA
tara:strand:- start:653 stop:1213 length:561 start_codon:yes stop_codon:yes gene_type:complete